jgi:hypothetical protein
MTVCLFVSLLSCVVAAFVTVQCLCDVPVPISSHSTLMSVCADVDVWLRGVSVQRQRC